MRQKSVLTPCSMMRRRRSRSSGDIKRDIAASLPRDAWDICLAATDLGNHFGECLCHSRILFRTFAPLRQLLSALDLRKAEEVSFQSQFLLVRVKLVSFRAFKRSDTE